MQQHPRSTGCDHAHKCTTPRVRQPASEWHKAAIPPARLHPGTARRRPLTANCSRPSHSPNGIKQKKEGMRPSEQRLTNGEGW
eukprot:5378629-Prymnesium_polylepis.1